MKLYTYQGETPDEALRKARGVHGDDSMIISTKEIRKKSLTEKGLYEVVIAAEDKVEVAPPNSVKQKLEQIAQKHTLNELNSIAHLLDFFFDSFNIFTILFLRF